MRIISQDGMIDVPYEMVALHEYDGKIRMNMAGDTGKGTVLAEYSTEAKARKAMEMLHRTYNYGREIRTPITDCSFKSESIKVGYFQFPADDKVEG